MDDLKRELPTFPVTDNVGDMSAFDSYRSPSGVRFEFSAMSYLRDQISVKAHRGSEWFRDTLLLQNGKWVLRPNPPSAFWQNIPADWKTEPTREPSSTRNSPLLEDGKWLLRPGPPSSCSSDIPVPGNAEPEFEPSRLDQSPWNFVNAESITDGSDPWQIVSMDEADGGSQ